MNDEYASLLAAACTFSTVILSRSLTATLFALTSRGVAWSVRAIGMCFVAIPACFLAYFNHPDFRAMAAFAVVLVYYAILALCAHAYGQREEPSRLTDAARLMVLVLLCVVFPCVVADSASSVCLVAYGLELALSMHSYCAESTNAPVRTRSDAVFFLLVNPVLVWSERGTRLGSCRLTVPAGRRMLSGALFILLAALLMHAQLMAAPVDAPEVFSPGSLLVQGAGLALLHTGIASFQIGGMACLGWKVAERYRWPEMLASPTQFWRCWNTYFASWLRRYVFLGMTKAIRGTRIGRVTPAVLPLSMVGTFMVSGLLHDVASYMSPLPFAPVWTLAFITAGLVTAVPYVLRSRASEMAQREPAWRKLARAPGLGALTTLLHGFCLLWMISDWGREWLCRAGTLLAHGL